MGLGLGLGLIVIAFFVALRSTGDNSTPRPQVAESLATRLHESPTLIPTNTPTLTTTPTVTPTATLFPTVTPIPGWARLPLQGAELWVPNVDPATLSPMLDREANHGIDRDVFFLLGINQLDSREPAQVGIRIARIRVGSRPAQAIPIALDADLTGFYEEGRRPAVGRYGGVESFFDGPTVAGDRFKRLVYWFQYGDYYWVITFTARGDLFTPLIPLFEASIRTFSVKTF